jgi:hypothetical protein
LVVPALRRSTVSAVLVLRRSMVSAVLEPRRSPSSLRRFRAK